MEGREGIDDRLLVGDASFLADGEVGDGLTAAGDDARKVVGLELVFGEPLLVEADHGGEIATRRVTADKNLFTGTAVLADVTECPGDRGGCILDICGGLGLRTETIICSHDRDALVLESHRDGAIPPGQAPAMEPNHRGKILHADGEIDIQLAAGPGIGVGMVRLVGDVGFSFVFGIRLGLGRRHSTDKAEEIQGQKAGSKQ